MPTSSPSVLSTEDASWLVAWGPEFFDGNLDLYDRLSRFASPTEPQEAARQMLEIGGERIEMWALMRGVNRMQSELLETTHEWGEEGDDDQWLAVKCGGSPNDREWTTIESAPTLVSLLAKLGGQK